jgi:hypothetical protein
VNIFKSLSWSWIREGIKTLSAIPISAYIASVTCILAFSSWPPEVANTRIQFLGMGLLGALVVLALSLFLVKDGIESFYLKNDVVEIGFNKDEGKEDEPK